MTNSAKPKRGRKPSPPKTRSATTSSRRDGRALLLQAATELFASEGLHAVSLRQINERAGMRNASASQYHFGDRRGLIRSVIAEHQPEVDARRHAMLDMYEADPRPGFMQLADALVRPWAPKLESPGGPGYLRVLADLLSSPRPLLPAEFFNDPSDSIARWVALVEPLLTEDDRRLHKRFTAYQFAVLELARRARARDPDDDDRLFLSHLVDMVVAILSCPASDLTARLLAERRRTLDNAIQAD